MPTNDYVISLLLDWSQRVEQRCERSEQSAEERSRLAEEREEAEWRAVQIELDNITKRNEEQRHWNSEQVICQRVAN